MFFPYLKVVFSFLSYTRTPISRGVPRDTRIYVRNAGGDQRACLLEFGRGVDLTTFQKGFTAARAYFRQMLTLRTLVADSFWQGFASGTGAEGCCDCADLMLTVTLIVNGIDIMLVLQWSMVAF